MISNSPLRVIIHKISKIAEDEEKLRKLMFRAICALLAAIALFMSLSDMIQYKQSTFPFPTLVFSILCVVNIFLYGKSRVLKSIATGLFMLELIGMIYFLVTSGMPDGFSALWIAMIPTFGLIILRRRIGSIFFLVTFAELVFLLWTPWGNSLLQYEYPRAFLLRFPVLYLVLFATALMFEVIRGATHLALEKARNGFEQLYIRDALTGIYNRYGFRQVREGFFADAENGRAMAMLDLDYFKSINDRLGHDAGDDILLEFVAIVKEVVGNDGILSRWGGEEFMLLLNEADRAEEICQKVRKAVEEHTFVTDAGQTSMTVSIGVVIGKKGEVMKYQQVLRLADRALFRAKDEGRNRIIAVPYAESDMEEAEPQGV